VTVVLTQAAPHHLIADGTHGADGTDAGSSAIRSLRRLRSGDAWQARQDAPAETGHAVTLGMPSIGAPAPLPAAPACG
jgi:tRNA-2-methylthio-N6-dimethylallyladenosine synthase